MEMCHNMKMNRFFTQGNIEICREILREKKK